MSSIYPNLDSNYTVGETTKTLKQWILEAQIPTDSTATSMSYIAIIYNVISKLNDVNYYNSSGFNEYEVAFIQALTGVSLT